MNSIGQARIKRVNTEHCDVLIIGGGPEGISAGSKVVLQRKKAIITNDGPARRGNAGTVRTSQEI